MKKALVLPYFGQFNSYFELWLASCTANAGIDFHIFTDSAIEIKTGSNVHFHKITFEELKEMFERKFNRKICLNRPYKLCDYKPYYGYLFEDYMKNYDFWGYCDCDLIWGDISAFLTDEIFENNDKLLRTGHLSFVRNNSDIIQNFKRYDTYKTVITSPVIYGYDESIYGYHLGFAGELIENGYRFFQNDAMISDVDFRHFPFFEVCRHETACVYEFCNGKAFRLEYIHGNLNRTETMYVHFQKRQMSVGDGIDSTHFLAIPNSFIAYNESLLNAPSFWSEISEEQSSYFDYSKEKWDERKRSAQRWFYEPDKVRSILYRIGKRK